MRKAYYLLLVTCYFAIGVATAQVNPKPFVVPELKTWTGSEGQFIPSGRIAYQGGREAKAVAQRLATDYQLLTGRTLKVVSGKAKKGDIVLVLNKVRGGGLQAADKGVATKEPLGGLESAAPYEGYRLDITTQTATVTAATTRGLTWGTRTLLQLTEQSADRALPCGQTEDEPEYALRGFMIDCGRKFIPMSYLRSLVKTMAYYKMNYLQIHLNDNGFRQFFGDDWSKTQAAFRLESDYFPGLTAKDGHYTKQEFIDLQKLAEEEGVEIVPEFDVPAHSLAFSHYRPSLGSQKYGMDHLDLSNPATYTFVDSLFQEYLEGPNPVFRGRRMHIGTDEYSNADPVVVEQFRAFTDHYIRFVERFGKQAVVWGALTHAAGSTPVKSAGVVMNIWYNGFAQPRDMKEQGYKLISIPDGLVYIVPAAGYYHDYLDCQYLYNTWTPAQIASEKFDERDPAIEGGMFAVWNDHAGNGITVKDIHDRVFPALQTMAVKTWTGAKTTLPYAAFDTLRTRLSEAPGVNEAAKLRGGALRGGGLQAADKGVATKEPLCGLRGGGLQAADSPQALSIAEVLPGQTLDVEEVGYNYTVSFTVTPTPRNTGVSPVNATAEAEENTRNTGVSPVNATPEAEDKGTILFESANATFYLADPVHGQLGFSRDGYLNTFNYRLPTDRAVRITVEGDNRQTRLLVDGREVQRLEPQTLYVINAERNLYGRSCGNQYQGTQASRLCTDPQSPQYAAQWRPEVIPASNQMRYVRTLVFPLRHAGQFKSRITDLKVEQR